MPKVSVIICAYNTAKFLPRSIDSVLSQDFKDFELIIIDDGSTDNTKDLIYEYSHKDERIKYFKNDINLGISKSRNRGINIAQGEYIAMLDGDDWWLKEYKLSKQVEELDSDPAIGLIGTGIVLFSERGDIIKDDIFKDDDGEIRRNILAKNQFAQSAVMFRKDAVVAAGLYDENLIVCEDLDLWLKIGLRYKLKNLKEALTAYFISSGGMSKLHKKRVIKLTDKIIKKYKMDYPGYPRAKIKSILRMIIG